jgi:hypothetical protein
MRHGTRSMQLIDMFVESRSMARERENEAKRSLSSKANNVNSCRDNYEQKRRREKETLRNARERERERELFVKRKSRHVNDNTQEQHVQSVCDVARKQVLCRVRRGRYTRITRTLTTANTDCTCSSISCRSVAFSVYIFVRHWTMFASCSDRVDRRCQSID